MRVHIPNTKQSTIQAPVLFVLFLSTVFLTLGPPPPQYTQMTVYSKVLFGEVEVSSFDVKEACQCEKNCLAIKGFRTMPVSVRRSREHWTSESGALKTLMQEGNLHQFTACKASCVLDGECLPTKPAIKAKPELPTWNIDC